MTKLRPYHKINVLLMLFVGLVATTTQAQANNAPHKYSIGIGYSRLPLESMEEYAFDIPYAPLSLLASYEPSPYARFTLFLGAGSEKSIIHRDITVVHRQSVLGLGAYRLWKCKRFTPSIGVRTGLVRQRTKSSNSSLGRIDVDSYFIQAITGGEVAISSRLSFGMELSGQFAYSKFFERGGMALDVRQYPITTLKFGFNVLLHYSLPW
ncbi:MAG: hypothetical protein ACETWG_07655 [Candidatus Neomarinimicrobiota bacterium]